MRKLLTIAAALFVPCSFAFVGMWALAYPEPDPKIIKYILWKHGLYRMNLDTVSDTMIGDANREMLVLGKTKVELREQFGYLSTLSEASPYLRGCYENSDWNRHLVC